MQNDAVKIKRLKFNPNQSTREDNCNRQIKVRGTEAKCLQ